MTLEHEYKDFCKNETDNVLNSLSIYTEASFENAFVMMMESRNVIVWKFLDEAGPTLYKAVSLAKNHAKLDDISRNEGYAWGQLFCALHDLATNGAGTKNELKAISAGEKTMEYKKKNFKAAIDTFKEQLDAFEGKRTRHNKSKRIIHEYAKLAKENNSPFADIVEYAAKHLG